jgi:hypothetical protein
MDTSGFYKVDDMNNKLMWAPNFVDGNNSDGITFTLVREDKDAHTYPVEGWYWFDSAEEASQFFNMPPPA